MMFTVPGNEWGKLNRRALHIKQNPLSTLRPLSPKRVDRRTSPKIRTAERGTLKTETYGAPLVRWQARQEQLAVKLGGAEHS